MPPATSASRRGGRVGRPGGPGPLRDVPTAAVIAGSAPAELAAFDLAPTRALALIGSRARSPAGRADPGGERDRRLLAISDIGPWTIQCLGFAAVATPTRCPRATSPT